LSVCGMVCIFHFSKLTLPIMLGAFDQPINSRSHQCIQEERVNPQHHFQNLVGRRRFFSYAARHLNQGTVIMGGGHVLMPISQVTGRADCRRKQQQTEY
ncbi:MAG TPA: hypothetical protein VJG31_01860, partial [Candidatus Nanoarchaeia archaeon]|nr:hypothetical protein [Candidatus Nanoarchaeia archaeon]